MQPRLPPEDIDSLIERIRVVIHAASKGGIELSSKELSLPAQELQKQISEQLGLRALKAVSNDADLENAARICAHYAVGASMLRELVSMPTAEPPDRWVHILGEQLAVAFRALVSVALLLSQAEGLLRQFMSAQRSPLDPRETFGGTDELDLLFEATIHRYEQGHWKTASQAARQITPEIVELAADLANRRAGRPVLITGTSKPLEWIRRHRRSKV